MKFIRLFSLRRSRLVKSNDARIFPFIYLILKNPCNIVLYSLGEIILVIRVLNIWKEIVVIETIHLIWFGFTIYMLDPILKYVSAESMSACA